MTTPNQIESFNNPDDLNKLNLQNPNFPDKNFDKKFNIQNNPALKNTVNKVLDQTSNYGSVAAKPNGGYIINNDAKNNGFTVDTKLAPITVDKHGNIFIGSPDGYKEIIINDSSGKQSIVNLNRTLYKVDFQDNGKTILSPVKQNLDFETFRYEKLIPIIDGDPESLPTETEIKQKYFEHKAYKIEEKLFKSMSDYENLNQQLFKLNSTQWASALKNPLEFPFDKTTHERDLQIASIKTELAKLDQEIAQQKINRDVYLDGAMQYGLKDIPNNFDLEKKFVLNNLQTLQQKYKNGEITMDYYKERLKYYNNHDFVVWPEHPELRPENMK